jgi:hypothetical protein
MVMNFLKPKNPVEKAEQETAKVQYMKAKIQNEKLAGQYVAAREKRLNPEIRRLRA